MATSSKKTAVIVRLNDELKLKILKKENPFKDGTIQAKKAEVILSSSGKKIGDVKKLKNKLVDNWAIREMLKRKIVTVVKNAA